MKRSYTRESCGKCSSRAIVVPIIENGENTAAKEVINEIKKHEGSKQQLLSFKGKRNEIILVEADGGKTVLGIGLGESPTRTVFREAMAKCLNMAASKGFSSCSIYLDELRDEFVSACIEGATLGRYRFNRYKSQSTVSTLTQVKIGTVQKSPIHQSGTRMVKNACIRADAVTACRDLVNEPANKLGVMELIAAAREIAQRDQLRCRVISGNMLKKKGFGLIHGVGKGAAVPPALIELEYTPTRKKGKRIALIGKGVVFDSGGLCLKPAASMINMKTDMAGAAVVLGVMGALTELSVEHNITAYIPLAENAIGPGAMRPGDILKSYSGKTVEVVNTDAEGRLLLADALALAKEQSFDEIVDFATLTGACSIALGRKRGAIFCDNSDIMKSWLKAAENAGELIWPLPLAPELEKEIYSDIADLKNSGDRFGGTISAALFLKHFTDVKHWVHFDIAGPARNSAANLLCPKGGTGFMVLTVLTYLQQ